MVPKLRTSFIGRRPAAPMITVAQRGFYDSHMQEPVFRQAQQHKGRYVVRSGGGKRPKKGGLWPPHSGFTHEIAAVEEFIMERTY
jgi:hypothetical protein